MNDLVRIETALLSVSDKTGLVGFARFLASYRVKLISTGGTAKALRDGGLTVIDISEHTGFPEMLDGRVKTLHPKVHGGLLYIRDNPLHEATVKEHGIERIDLVVVNLYPFAQTIATPGVTEEKAVENIDIGGPSMLRSGAKNFDAVASVCNPKRYGEIEYEFLEHNGCTTRALRRSLAAEVFKHTGAYDLMIGNYMEPPKEESVPEASKIV